jgi:tetratricopeptide (TPR) repeat protein
MMVAYTYTDPTGRYNFRNLSQGVFIIKVHSDGKYAGQSVRIVLQALRNSGASHYEQVDFMLKELLEKRSATATGSVRTTFVQEVPEAARRAYERGVRTLDTQREQAEGIASLQEALTIFPKYYNALERLGIEYVRLERYEEARQLLTLAVGVNRSGAPSFYGLGVAQFHTGRMDETVNSPSAPPRYWPLSRQISLSSSSLLDLPSGDSTGTVTPSHTLEEGSRGLGWHSPRMFICTWLSITVRVIEKQEAAAELELFLKLVPNAQDAEKIRGLIKKLKAKG